jgi:hypothetical protein
MQTLTKTKEEPNNFEQTKKQLFENYKRCGIGAFYLPAAGGSWIWSKLRRDRTSNAMGNALGIYSAIFMIPLTPVTIAGGAVAAIANTAWGLYGLPAAKIKDHQISKKQKTEKQLIDDNSAYPIESSSTKQFLQAYGVQESAQHVHVPLTNLAIVPKPAENKVVHLDSPREDTVEPTKLASPSSLRK